jgi:predicted ester cyclase
MLHAAFDDFQVTEEEEMIVEGDIVATRWTASGVYRGAFMGLARPENRCGLPARGFTGF